MTTTRKKMSRLRKVVLLAAAIGCSSASLSGVLATLAIQHQPPAAERTLA